MQIDISIVGAVAGGLAAATSLLKQNPKLTVTAFDPTDEQNYQPVWTWVVATSRRKKKLFSPWIH